MERNITYVFGQFQLKTDTRLLRYQGKNMGLQLLAPIEN